MIRSRKCRAKKCDRFFRICWIRVDNSLRPAVSNVAKLRACMQANMCACKKPMQCMCMHGSDARARVCFFEIGMRMNDRKLHCKLKCRKYMHACTRTRVVAALNQPLIFFGNDTNFDCSSWLKRHAWVRSSRVTTLPTRPPSESQCVMNWSRLFQLKQRTVVLLNRIVSIPNKHLFCNSIYICNSKLQYILQFNFLFAIQNCKTNFAVQFPVSIQK